MSFFPSHDFIDLLQNSLPLSTHILFGLRLVSFKTFWKLLVIVIPFLSFKGITHGYFLKISITHNKKQIFSLILLINYISAKLAPQIFCTTGECTFLFSNFLIIDLCNSSDNSWMTYSHFWYHYQKFFIKRLIWYSSKFGCLAILNALSCNILWETVLLHKPFHVQNKLCLVRFNKYIVNLLFLQVFVFFLWFL